MSPSAGAVGIDVGGTYSKICLVGPGGAVRRSVQIPTRPDEDPARFVQRLTAVIGGWDFASLGLGLAGGVDHEDGSLLFAPNLKRWLGFPFRKVFERLLGVPVAADNDANAAVWGGYVLALRKRPRHVIGFCLGTGVGGGLIIDGRLHRGSTRSAGEIGHQTLSPSGPRCSCGKRGCLEAYAGTEAILRCARKHMRRPPHPLTPRAVCSEARAGNRGAVRVWEEVGGWLGLGIANACLTLDPEAVLLLGGVARAGRLLLEPVRRVLDAQPFRQPFEDLVLRAPTGHDWGCVGAALLSREAR